VKQKRQTTERVEKENQRRENKHSRCEGPKTKKDTHAKREEKKTGQEETERKKGSSGLCFVSFFSSPFHFCFSYCSSSLPALLVSLPFFPVLFFSSRSIWPKGRGLGCFVFLCWISARVLHSKSASEEAEEKEKEKGIYR
jgi:hypothetical protein